MQLEEENLGDSKSPKNNFNFRDAQTMIRYAINRIAFDYWVLLAYYSPQLVTKAPIITDYR